MGFVIDASVTLTWCFADERTPATESLLDRVAEERVVAPALWISETTNALLSAIRRGRVTPDHASQLQSLLTDLPIEIDTAPSDRRALLEMARRHALSAYDATYLLLAQRTALPLATLDSRLREAATAEDVPVLPQAAG